MKRVLVVLFSLLLLIGVGTPTYAASDKDISAALELITKTNKDIDGKIERAVKKADELQASYLIDIRKIEEGDTVVTLKNDREKVLADLTAAKNDSDKNKLTQKLNDINEKLAIEQAKIESKINALQKDIDDATSQLVSTEEKDTKKLEEKIQKLSKKLLEKETKAVERTLRYTGDLDKVITDVYNETMKMSIDTIKKAADKGVIAECEWKLVRFADRWEWIDPIRVVKI